jgi:hypothetical protein
MAVSKNGIEGFIFINVKSHFEGLDAQRGLARYRHLLADLCQAIPNDQFKSQKVLQ